MLALLLAGYVLAVRQKPPELARLAGASTQDEAARGAIAGMQASAGDAWSALETYLRERNPAHAEAFRQADANLVAGLARLGEGAPAEGQRAAAREIGERHARFSADADLLLRESAAPDHVAPFNDYRQRTLRALAADMPEARPGRSTGRESRKREAVEQLRAALREGADASGAAPDASQPAPDAQALVGLVARYQAFADTAEERTWAERAARAVRDGEQQAQAVEATESARRAAMEKAQASHAALLATLAWHARGDAAAGIEDVLGQADREVKRSHARLADMLLTLLGIGVLIALVTLHAVRAPLRRLAASTRGYIGALSFVSLAAPGDEVAELQWALTRLTQRDGDEGVRENSAATEDERLRPAAVAFAHSSQPMLMTDGQRAILLANAAFTELTGYLTEDVKGRSFEMLWSPDHHDPAALAAIWAELEKHGRWQGGLSLRTKDGDVRPASATLTAVRGGQGALEHVVLALNERAAPRAADDDRPLALPRKPERDPISAASRARVCDALAAAEGASAPALLCLYVPSLHRVADALGEDDAQQLGADLRNRVAQAVGARGEVLDNDAQEPLVLVEDAGDSEALARIAHDLVRALSAPALFNGLELPLHPSIGIAQAPADGDIAETLIQAARAAVEQARAAGGGGWRFTSEALTAQLRERMVLVDELLDPGLTSQLALHYQPMLALRTGKAVGVEALLRWRHPVRGMLGPDAFLPAAERAGVMPEIGEWVLRSACGQARRWVESGLPPLRVAVNLSRAELEHPGLAAGVQRALADSGVDGQALQIEISEHSLEGVRDVSQALLGLQRLGATLTLACARDSDVAGRALTWLPFTRVKIRAALRPQDERSTPGIVALARGLGASVIAEAVESEAQAAALRAQGVDELQGFVIGRPTAAREFELRMRHANGRAPAATPADAS